MTDLNQDDFDFKKLYQSYINKEVANPETARAKEKLIKDYFTTKNSFKWPPIFIPVMGVACVGFLIFGFYFSQYGQNPNRSVTESISPDAKVVITQSLIEQKDKTQPKTLNSGDVLTKTISGSKIETEPHVSVMRVSSKTGPTMVYQKMYNDALITVVWVFPGGN